MVEPGEPEEVALVAVGLARVLAAVGVEGDQVEEVVEDGERPRQLRRGVGEVVRGRLEVAHERAEVAHERADLGPDDRRGLLAQGQGRLVGLVERRADRAQVPGRRPEDARERLDLAERRGRLAQRSGQKVDRARDAALLAGECAEDMRRRVDELGEVGALAGQLAVEDVEVVDEAAQVLAPLVDRGGEAREVAVGRLEAAQQIAQVGAAALQALAGAVDEQLEVVARVAVQRPVELVGVDVGQRVRDRDREAVLDHRRPRRARLQLEEHVLQAGLRAQEHGRVRVDHAGVLGVDVHRHDPAAVLEVDARDVADAHAGHADGLPLAGGDRLGGREARLERQRRRLPREAQPLVGQDVRPAPGGCRDDPDDQEEVARVLADRPDHRPLATFALKWPNLPSPLRCESSPGRSGVSSARSWSDSPVLSICRRSHLTASCIAFSR